MPLTTRERIIAALQEWGPGRENALHPEVLAVLAGATPTYVRAAVSRLRAEGLPVGTSRGTPRGYFWCTNDPVVQKRLPLEVVRAARRNLRARLRQRLALMRELETPPPLPINGVLL